MLPSSATAPEVVAERELRLARFDELEPEGWVARGVSPGVLRQRVDDFCMYSGQAGIYCDVPRTRALAHPAVAVSVMHSGRHYPDDVQGDCIVYQYPRTRRPGQDSTEIAATKNASELRLPIYVITQEGSLRDVYLSWVEEWDDNRGEFLITFAQSGVPPTPLDLDGEPEWVKLIDAPVTIAEVKQRNRDPHFAFRVFRRYGSVCAVCGLVVGRLIDAAHIIPVAAGGSHDPRNGLPLCPTHHRAFDMDAFVINPHTLELVTLGVDSLGDLKIPLDTIRHLPAFPHSEALEWRWDRVQ